MIIVADGSATDKLRVMQQGPAIVATEPNTVESRTEIDSPKLTGTETLDALRLPNAPALVAETAEPVTKGPNVDATDPKTAVDPTERLLRISAR